MITEETEKGSWTSNPATKSPTVVIDGDWLAFVGACMTHVTNYIAIDPETGNEVCIETNEKTFEKKVSKLKLEDSSKELVITKEKRLIDDWQSTAKGVMIGKANKLKRECGGARVLIAIGGKTNFRDHLSLLYSSYKDRKGSYRPPNLSECRALLKTLFAYEESENCEADDLISRYQYLRTF